LALSPAVLEWLCCRTRKADKRHEEMMPIARWLAKLGFFAALLASSLAPAAAQPVTGDYYAGKTVQLIIGFGVGGGYDLWARTLGRHIGKHLPGNPNVVPQNMPGAGSFIAANHIYSVAPKDGTVFGIIARDAPLGPITGASGARFDATNLSWIGSPTTETNVCIVHHTASVKSARDLLEKEAILGDTGPGTGTRVYPKALAGILGMKFKLVGGFPSSSNVFLAMERGEVEGICESYDSVINRKPDWVASGKILILFQGGAAPNPELKNVPFILDFARNADDRQALEFLYAGQGIGRPFVAPPDLPAERLKMLRDAFDATMRDAEFLADAKRQKLDVEPVSGAQLEALIKKIYATPPAIVERVGSLVK
jgi:tripartite-type tricarboxylate transporter receptor subunit TctC